MNIEKEGRYEINSDLFKTISLEVAIETCGGSIPEKVITKVWKRLNPIKRKKKDADQED